MPSLAESARGTRPKKIAIVGSGCAGLGALWALKSSQHEVYLYEAAERLGGHTNTCEWTTGKYKTAVDTGFIVLNTATYPNFINFLANIGVETVPTEMTFGVSRDHGKFEWSGTNLGAIFCMKRNIFSVRMWRMIFDIVRFNQFALDLLREEGEMPPLELTNGWSKSVRGETIGEYLEREGYSDTFRDDYLIPMTAAVWSTSPDKCSLEFPAVTLVRFLWNHHLLSTIAARPQWLTLKNGAQAYIDAIMADFPKERVFVKTPVRHVSTDNDRRVRLHLDDGRSEAYDHVVLATHGDQAYELVRDSASDEEHTILSCFKTSQNVAVLHSDLSLMPRRHAAWSAWNYLTLSSAPNGKGNIDQVSLTYDMNILQHIPADIFGDVLVTLNPLHEPDPRTVQGRYSYAHPLYTPAAVRAQKMLHKIQNTRGISYAGAWTKYGFHEDGFSSGLLAAQEHLGARLPFAFRDSTFSRGRRPVLTTADTVLRIVIWLVQVLVVRVLERVLRVERRPLGGGETASRSSSRDQSVSGKSIKSL